MREILNNKQLKELIEYEPRFNEELIKNFGKCEKVQKELTKKIIKQLKILSKPHFYNKKDALLLNFLVEDLTDIINAVHYKVMETIVMKRSKR